MAAHWVKTANFVIVFGENIMYKIITLVPGVHGDVARADVEPLNVGTAGAVRVQVEDVLSLKL
jgi:hypothetical protein